MIALRCARALLPEGWRASVRVEVDASGRIRTVLPEAPHEESSGPAGERVLEGWVIPGMPNLHAHAFQRALVGRTEHAARVDDSFWTWREAMYALAETLDAAALEAVAAEAYVEMLEAGYTAVGEFHYLHHRADGHPFPRPAELLLRLAETAERVGIRLTALPVLYLHGGFGVPPAARQRRFVHASVHAFLRLLEAARAGLPPDRTIGVAPHSLRAVDLDALEALLAGATDVLGPDAPVHIHVAEQPAEVAACRAALGHGPVEALLERFDLGERWCLIHATHVPDPVLAEVARRGAVVGLCPSTEGNLGDGLFPIETYLAAGGRFGVGTDSQVVTDPTEELRWLDHQARARTGRRNPLARDGDPPRSGRTLWTRAVAGGRQALGVGPPGLVPGAVAELVELDPEHPRLVGLTPEEGLDAFVLGGARPAIRTVWVGDRAVVEEGRHVLRDRVDADWAGVARELGGVLG